MAPALPLPPPVEPRAPLAPIPPAPRFTSLVLEPPRSLARQRSLTLSASLMLHTLLLGALVLVPILYSDVLPVPGDAVRAFFVTPPVAAPPPPPPPPAPAAGARMSRAPAAPRPEPATTAFVAPIEVPSQIKIEEPSLDLSGVQGGVPGGVEGGIPGGVVGGIVGGLPSEAPAPPPTKVVRIGGALVAPKLVRSVRPEYPALAAQARVQAVIILEAQVDTRGFVKNVHVLRGSPLFDDAAVEAVKQWRYQPLLLNGEPTEFILTVTLLFNLQDAQKANP